VNKASILIVDDEPGVRSALSGVLRDEGYQVDAVESGEQCLDRVVREVFDVIVLDVWLPGLDGLATLGRLRQMKVDAQVVMISGHGNIESAVKAIKTGAFDFVAKRRTAPCAPVWIAPARWSVKVSSCGNSASRWRWPRPPTAAC
jgi:two-component system, NtrC family, nitrogen regulation response regulator NtrX